MNQAFEVERTTLDEIDPAPSRLQTIRRERLPLFLAMDRAFSIDSEAGGMEVEDGQEKELVHALHSIDKNVKAIIGSTDTLFRVVAVSKHRYEVRATPIGRAFLVNEQIAPLIEEHFVDHLLKPRFNLLQKYVASQSRSPFLGVTCATKEDAMALAEPYNAVIAAIRAEGLSKKFIASCKNFHRSSTKNYRELLAYVKRHSELTGRLLLCRCDVGMKKAAKFQQKSRMQQLQILRHARKALFKFIKTNFGDGFLGFAWKLEFGRKRGFHFHLLFIFNGRELNSDIPIVRMIGEHWKNEIMFGEGTYYNCNAFKGSYKECGIGQYSKNIDTGKWKGIELMCAYLTKADDLVRLHFEGMRTFGKGNLPKPKEKSKTMAELSGA